MDTLAKVFAISVKGDNFYDFLFDLLPAPAKPLLKWVYCKREEFFPFRVDPI